MRRLGSYKWVAVALLAIGGLVLAVAGGAEDEPSMDVDSCDQICETAEAECHADCVEADDPEGCEEACSEEADACYEGCE